MAGKVECGYCGQFFPLKKMKMTVNLQFTHGKPWICKDEQACLQRALEKKE